MLQEQDTNKIEDNLEEVTEEITEVVGEDVEEVTGVLTDMVESVIDFAIDHGPKLILVSGLFFVGMFVIKKLVLLIKKLMEKSNVEVSLIPFVLTITSVVLKVLLIISLAEMVGFKTTSFLAILGAAGLAVGLALQGALTNFAGGVLILVFKPYRVGDFVLMQGEKGTVNVIQILTTTIITPENKTVIIPNGSIANGNITNYTREGVIRVDLTFGISYESNIKTAKDVLLKVMRDSPSVYKDPEPFVGVEALADSSVNIAARAFCNPDDYWAVLYELYEAGKIGLDEAGITIPFPQLDLHMKKE